MAKGFSGVVVYGNHAFFEAAVEIFRRSRGTPRIANSLLRRVRDFAQVKGNGTITYDIAQMALMCRASSRMW